MKYKLQNLIPLYLLLIFSLNSCEVIGTIFKAGVWVGIIIIVIIIVIIAWIVRKASKN
jgi:TRAP-type C4-dicarboxylate transport system permease large subunit